REYQLATDSRPVRDLMAECLKPLADAILAEQLFLKNVQSQKLPKWATALLSIGHEPLALITLGELLIAISRSEYEDCLAPAVTAIAYEIGQRCRIQRIHDCYRHREVDLEKELCPRNRNRNAGRRAREWARKIDDEKDWAKNNRSFHLGQKLIGLAVRFAQIDGQPVFELATVRESDDQGTTTTQRIALTAAAAELIASHPSPLA